MRRNMLSSLIVVYLTRIGITSLAFGPARWPSFKASLYMRTPRLLADLALSRGDGRSVRRLAHLAKIGVLVLDDFLLTPPSVIEAKDLLEVIDDRSQVRSTLVISQLPVEAWHPSLAAGDPTLADAILDRLIHDAHRLALKGGSMRRRQPPQEESPSA